MVRKLFLLRVCVDFLTDYFPLLELGIASTIVKKVYERNVALKSKHEAFLARIPMSPTVPSPDHVRSRKSMSAHFPNSVSESSVSDQFTTTHTRRVSIAMADISLLADQNAELLGKLQKLEEDSTSADVAGRRELKRLEKEIAHLREALEKTQAKSEELEGKVKNAVTSDAVWRKREREREVMKSAERDKGRVVVDFAPPGSKYGGPSEAYPLLDNDSPGWKRHGPPTTPSRTGTGGDMGDSPDQVEEPQDQILICQLLQKVKELEEANERILKQQTETASQLATVQRDAMTMTKVYEFLSDRDAIELELEPDANGPIRAERVQVETEENLDPPTIRFRSLKRNIEKSFGSSGSESFLYPGTANETTKSRRSVLGLFNEQEEDASTSKESNGHKVDEQSVLRQAFPSHERCSSTSSMPPTPLSPLNFFSPLSQSQSELPHGLTLQKELENKFGQESWCLAGSNLMRSNSLSNLSQFSVPPTPSPAPGLAIRNVAQDDSDHLALSETDSRTPRGPVALRDENPLMPSVEPPTPTPDQGGQSEQTVPPETIQKTNSSRLQDISKTLRLRKHRWLERMQGTHESTPLASKEASSSSPFFMSKAKVSPPKHLSNAVSENFQGISASNANSNRMTDNDSEENDAEFGRLAYDDHLEAHEEPIARSATPKPSSKIALQTKDTRTTSSKRHDEQTGKNTYKDYVFQVWLWFQFAIVVFVFIFTMAKKGPGAVLVSGNDKSTKKAVVRR